jgi:hypothetical protein
MHIDYLTVTCADAREFEASKRVIIGYSGDKTARKQEFYGFEGLRWDDGDYGSRFVGVRIADGCAMISCSGRTAHIEALRLRFLSCWQPSRVDIAVDVSESFDVPGAYVKWQGKTRTKLTAIEDQTLYIGSRKSEIFWRIYNKAEEMGRSELSPLWRIELELKGARAKQFWKAWQQPNAELLAILLAYLWDARGLPREPAHSLVYPFLEARDRWNLEPLPRRRRAGEEYLWGNVLPFLRDNWEWAGPIVIEQLMGGV